MQVQPLLIVEWIFLFFLCGSLIFEITHFQLISNISFPFFTKNISSLLGINVGLGKDITGAVYLFFVLPAVLWTMPYLLILLFRLRISLSSYLKNISIIFLPVITAFFAGVGIMEIATRVPYYKYIVNDVKGVETIKAILFKQIEAPQMPYWADWVFIVILLLALIIGLFVSFKVIRKLALKFGLQKNISLLYFLPVILISLFFAGVLAYKLF